MFDRHIALQARMRPLETAVFTGGAQVSYGEFDTAVDRLAAALEPLELAPGVPVAVRVADPYVHAVLLLALARLRTPFASVIASYADTLIPLIRPQAVLSDVPGAVPGVAKVLEVTPQWLAAQAARPIQPIRRPLADPSGLAQVIMSSGTTGTPKTIGLSWDQLEARTMTTALWQGGLKRFALAIGIEFGLLAALGTWSTGGAVQFLPVDPAAQARLLPQLAPTGLVISPIQLGALLAALPAGFRPMPELTLHMAGSQTPAALRRAARARLAPTVVLHYGSSEAGAVARCEAAQVGEDPNAAGWVSVSREAQVVDEDHRPLPAGELGRLRMRGAGVVDAYLDEPEASASAFVDGWFYPGDLGRMDEDGFLRVEGRADDIMNLGGEKHLPSEIETPALACLGVEDAAAFTVPDAQGVPQPWVAIVRGEGLNEADLGRALSLPRLPRIHVAWIEAIPRNPNGKVQRDRLRVAATRLPMQS